MSFWHLVATDGRALRGGAVALVGGLIGAGVVSMANLSLSTTGGGGSLSLGLAFLAATGLMYACNAWASRQLLQVLEDLQRDLRARFTDALARAPLRRIETLGARRGAVLDQLIVMAEASHGLVGLIGHGGFLAAVTLTLATLSGRALLIWMVVVAVVGFVLTRSIDRIRHLQARTLDANRRVHGALDDVIDGFVECAIDPVVGARVRADAVDANAAFVDAENHLIETSDHSTLRAFAAYFAVGFGLAVFAPSATVGLSPTLGYDVAILLSLALGPLFTLVNGLPQLARLDVTLAETLAVLTALEDEVDAAPGRGGQPFESIELHGCTFAYDDGAHIGPVDLTLRPGELLMVTGANGSGKTTLMKMVMGLYPVSGRIRWNGRAVSGRRLSDYRGLFTTILADPHLFDRPYGLDAPPERVTALLDRFGLAGVVRFVDGRFEPLDLSSGQRMRLAMVVAQLEDRPVLVFDEWTAHLDPETTRRYYDEVLPALLAEGRAVIAVSHDDRFFDRADRRIILERGRPIAAQPAGAADPT